MPLYRHAAACLLAFGYLCAPSPASLAEEQSATTYYEDALEWYRKGEFKSAELQLKNALRESPNHLASHVLLGRIYAEMGKLDLAESELRLAIGLGADRALVTVPIARIYLQRGKLDDVLALRAEDRWPATIRARLLIEQANAHMAQRHYLDAETKLIEARAVAPRSALPIAARARLALRQGHPKRALETAQGAVRLGPEEAKAWRALAAAQHAVGRHQKAYDTYGTVLELDSQDSEAKAARIGILIDLGRIGAAAEEVATARGAHPNDPRLAYLDALILQRQGKPEASRTALQEAVSLFDVMPLSFLASDEPLLLVAGLANYSLGRDESARMLLSKYIERNPDQPGPRKVLASLMLRADDAEEAIDLLEPMLDAARRDYRLLSLLGEAYMNIGRHETAIGILEQATELNPDDPELRTQFAIGLAETGRTAPALGTLADIFQERPEQGKAGIALIMLQLRLNRPEEAATAARRLAERVPDNLTVLTLLGTALARSGRTAEALEAFEKAERRYPEVISTQLNIARLEAGMGRIAEAEKRLLEALEQKPNNATVMAELAGLHERRGNLREAARWLERARKAAPDEAAHYLSSVDLLLRSGESSPALEVARDAQIKFSDNPEILEAVGRAYAATGEPNLAQAAYQEAVKQLGYSASGLFRLARRLAKIDALEEAVWALEKAMAGDPEMLPARVAHIELLISLGKLDTAADRLEELRGLQPDLPAVKRLDGDLAMARGRFDQAAAHYRQRLHQTPTSVMALYLYRSYLAGGRMAKGGALLQEWVDREPDDMLLRRTLAEHLHRTGNLSQAGEQYRAVLAQEPGNVQVLNNLAHVHLQRGDTAEALEMAWRAHEGAPEDADVKDTLGWILVNHGEAEEGLALLREAQTRDASNRAVHYHIAVALERLGRTAEALREADAALADDAQFPERADLEALRTRLRGSAG